MSKSTTPILPIVILLISGLSASADELEDAANNGDAEAQFEMAVRYEQGQGVTKDFERAIGWYRKAAEGGHPGAQSTLGWFYQNGQGVEQDIEKAISWYVKGVEQNEPSATHNLAVLYDEGTGVTEDNEKAVELYKRAAEQGHQRAQLNLGIMYGHGEGMKRDYIEAYKWLTIVRMDAPERRAKWLARGALDELEQYISRRDKKEGNKRAKQWRKKHRE